MKAGLRPPKVKSEQDCKALGCWLYTERSTSWDYKNCRQFCTGIEAPDGRDAEREADDG